MGFKIPADKYRKLLEVLETSAGTDSLIESRNKIFVRSRPILFL